jgi:hypothetical protein
LSLVPSDLLEADGFSLTDTAGLFINWVNNVVASRAYSRKLEEEADRVGLKVRFGSITLDRDASGRGSTSITAKLIVILS